MSSPSAPCRMPLRSSTNDVASPADHRKQHMVPPHAVVVTPADVEASRSDLSLPKAPRSAFMCFTDAKKKEIMDKRGILEENDDILNIVAEEWKNLSDKDRAVWDEESRDDKVRYVRAKAAYKGPNLIPKRRAKKHPMAPKRPMSAFLKFSQSRRQRVKNDNPDMSNTDVSRLLGEMWRNASPSEKGPYRDQEQRERAIYKEDIKKFKDDQARADAVIRTTHHSVHGHRHRHHAHPMDDHTAHHPRSFASPTSNTFETLRMDSFEEASHGNKTVTFRSHSLGSYPPCRQTYSYLYEPTIFQRQGDFNAEPVQFATTNKAPFQAMQDNNPTNGHYGSSRSGYFHDNMHMSHYTRYP